MSEVWFGAGRRSQRLQLQLPRLGRGYWRVPIALVRETRVDAGLAKGWIHYSRCKYRVKCEDGVQSNMAAQEGEK